MRIDDTRRCIQVKLWNSKKHTALIFRVQGPGLHPISLVSSWRGKWEQQRDRAAGGKQLLSLPSRNSREMCLILRVAKGKATKLGKDKGGINSNLINATKISSFSPPPGRKNCTLSAPWGSILNPAKPQATSSSNVGDHLR